MNSTTNQLGLFVTVVTAQFGPKHTAKNQERLLNGPAIVHSGCWVNDDWCGAEDCPMAHHTGKPITILR